MELQAIPGKHWNPFQIAMHYLKGNVVRISNWKADGHDTDFIHQSFFANALQYLFWPNFLTAKVFYYMVIYYLC